MNQQHVTLSLPLSATALREGSEFLAKLSALAEVIKLEAVGHTVQFTSSDMDMLGQQADNSLLSVGDATVDVGPVTFAEPATTMEQDVATAEAAVAPAPAAPAPIEYETVVTGTERNPDYAGDKAAFDIPTLEAAGWDEKLLLQEGYLREVTEQRVKPSAPGASAASAPPPPAAAPAAPSTFEVDKDGIIWDARIHSDAAERMSKEGYWKRRRNTPDDLWDSVRAELGVAAPTAPPAPKAPPAPGAGASMAPNPPAPAAPAATAGGEAMRVFTAWVMAHIKAGRLDHGKVAKAVKDAGLNVLPDLQKNPEYIPVVRGELIKDYGLEG